MARPGLSQNRKFRRLARVLGSDALARGSLELVWDTAYESGDDYLGEAQDVELAARWSGESGILCKALLEAGGNGSAGFIEQDPDRPGFRVHDLFQNAPEYVQKRMKRELERNQRGQTISELRRQAGRKGRAVQLAGKTQANGVQLPPDVGQAATNGDTPAPAPAPMREPFDASASIECDSEPVDPRHAPIRHLIQQLHLQKFKVKCQWDGSEGKALDRLLSANPSWSEEQIAGMVRNRFASDGITGSRPRSWLPRLDDYAGGSLDRYNKVRGSETRANGKPSIGEIVDREIAILHARRTQ